MTDRTRTIIGISLICGTGVAAVAGIIAIRAATDERPAQATVLNQAVSAAPAASRPAPAPAKPMAVAAAMLYRDYANEVAADVKYKGAVLCVSGRVSSIGKSVFDESEIAVRLMAGEMNFADAVLAPSETGAAGATKIGTKVSLLCIGNGVFAGAPLLRDCHFGCPADLASALSPEEQRHEAAVRAEMKKIDSQGIQFSASDLRDMAEANVRDRERHRR
jgi:hypothetical protein